MGWGEDRVPGSETHPAVAVGVTVVPDGGLFIVSELTLLNVPRAHDFAPCQLLKRVLDPA